MTYDDCQNWIGDLLLKRLGQAAKNIDDFIFQRMYKGIWFGILATCPQNLTKEPATHMVDRFRNTL